MTKLKNWNCDNSKTQMTTKLTKNQIVTKLKLRQNSNRDKIQIVTKVKLWQISIMKKKKKIKLKMWQNWNSDETQKLKWLPNTKTQFVLKLKNSYCDKTQKLKLWQNSRTQIMTKLQNSSCDRTQKLKLWEKKLEIWQISIYDRNIFFKESFRKNILTLWQLMRHSLDSVLQFSRCLLETDLDF